MVVVFESYAGLARRVLAAPARLGRTRLVAVDGPSGAGKTLFAACLADALDGLGPEAVRPPVVHTDDLLDGWDDQLTFWARLERDVLRPVRSGRAGSYRRYDWVRGCFRPEPVSVPVASVLIVEGVSTSRAAAGPDLTLAVFVTAPRPLRLARAVARDGPEILPELRRWHDTEQAHFAADDTQARADLVVDGDPGLPHDDRHYYLARPGTAGRGGIPCRS
ncbi:uridine kinase [Micromonospora sp. NPDC049900]|uniref:uridine kinase family protein n=1 Tax=unclassified Micromonospora TaxID=2617518 RepID=UPI0037ADD2EB